MKKIRSTRTINFRDTHKGRGFAFRGIDRQLAFSHKRRAPRTSRWDEGDSRIAYFGATRPRDARLRPRGQVIPEGVIEAPGISPARKPRIYLRPTGDGEACEDPRSRRISRSRRRQCDFTG